MILYFGDRTVPCRPFRRMAEQSKVRGRQVDWVREEVGRQVLQVTDSIFLQNFVFKFYGISTFLSGKRIRDFLIASVVICLKKSSFLQQLTFVTRRWLDSGKREERAAIRS